MSSLTALTGTAPARIQPAQTTRVPITLTRASGLARMFMVHFRFDKAFIEPCMRAVLRQVNDYALAHADEKLVIVGHCDKTGSSQYNQSLSERRARSVYAYLTLGRDQPSRTEALAEWNSLRQRRPTGELPSIRDTWDVREYQHILQDLGFYAAPVDGQTGPRTRDAVRAFRCAKGLPPGDTVDDPTWDALIADYLAQDNFGIPANRFLANCSGESLKWLGCGEDDPVDGRGAAWRPNRRVELLFVRADSLPCQVPQPDTFNLPAPGAVNSNWCVGPASGGDRCCFVTPADPRQTGGRAPNAWTRVPNETGTITVEGSIQREQAGGALAPVPNQPFVLIAPNGEFKAGEDAQGEAIPGRTNASGAFSFSNLPPGVYSLEVVTPANAPVLVRLADQTDRDIKGNAVCKALNVPGPSGGAPRLDVVIVNAPVLREIRLPVAAHVMVPLDSRTADVRLCPDSTGAPVPQVTQHTEAELRQFFEQANQVWRQARIRFDAVEIVREAYTHPIADPALRGSCPVDQSEFTFLLSRCAHPDAVNVYFFRDFAGSGEAGLGVSVENGAASGLPGGAAVADRASGVFGGVPIDVTLNAAQSAQVLAHELGHYLNLEHADEVPANADRLMLPGTATGANRTLIQTEIDRARTSQGAASSCVPLQLRVTGATQIGGSLSNQFIIIQNPARTVTVDAEIPDRLLDPSVGTLTMTGGSPGANPRQQTVNGANTGEFTVVATYTPVGGTPVVKRVVIRVATFTLRVEGATQVTGASGPVFVATQDATGVITVVAEINPLSFCIPTTLVTWTGGVEAANPVRRTVARATVTAAPVVVTATVAGVTRQVSLQVIADPAQPGPFAVGEHEYDEGPFTVGARTETFYIETRHDFLRDLQTSDPTATLADIPTTRATPAFSVRRRALVRYPAQSAGVDTPVATQQTNYPLVILAHGNHRSLYPDGTRVENFRGLEYLARHLASHGYIAVSIDLDDMNIPTRRDPTILQRGVTILEHITVMVGRNTSGPLFTGRVNLTQISLIGHSRGGEAVVAAQQINTDESRGHQIRGVVSIAPTDFLGITHTTTPYMLLYGSEDGDVSIGWPFRLYDRAAPRKALVFAYGASHNRFSTHPDWNGRIDPRVTIPYTPNPVDSSDARLLSEDDHLNMGRGYCLAFLDLVLGRQSGNIIFFNAAEPLPATRTVEVHHQFQEVTRLTVDDFAQGALNRSLPLPPQLATRAGANTLGRPVAASGLAVPGGFSGALTEASLLRRDLDFFWHDTVGAMIAWDSTTGSYTTEIGGRDVSAFQVLSFRVTQRFGSARNPSPPGVTPGAPQDFQIGITDTAGQSAFVRVGTITAIPFPYKRSDDLSLTKSALKTVRIPLARFQAVNATLRLNAVQSVIFQFRETARGEVAIDDIEFSN